MILLLGGTQDARMIGEKLKEKDTSFIYSVQTEYGKELTDFTEQVLVGSLEEKDLISVINEKKISLIVDATHPYAVGITENAIQSCIKTGTRYLRFERKSVPMSSDHCLYFKTQEEAADYLEDKPGKILLTTGSKELEAWKNIPSERLVIRVLPTSGVLLKCEKLGFKPYQIIAQQGPFSYNQDHLSIKEHNIDYLVTKDSGNIGKSSEKIKAALDSGATAIIIEKPKVSYPDYTDSIDTLMEKIENV